MFGLLSLQSAGTVVGGFPNVLISVAEMQMPNLLGAGMGSAFLANTNGVVNGMGGIFVLFAGLIVLYILVSRVFKLRKVSAPTPKESKGKPNKAERVSASKKIDDQRKFKNILNKLTGNDESNDSVKLGRIRPSVRGLGDSRYPARDCNLMLGLFSPYKFGLESYLGYDIKKFKDHILHE